LVSATGGGGGGGGGFWLHEGTKYNKAAITGKIINNLRLAGFPRFFFVFIIILFKLIRYFKIFMDLKNLTKQIYNENISYTTK